MICSSVNPFLFMNLSTFSGSTAWPRTRNVLFFPSNSFRSAARLTNSFISFALTFLSKPHWVILRSYCLFLNRNLSDEIDACERSTYVARSPKSSSIVFITTFREFSAYIFVMISLCFSRSLTVALRDGFNSCRGRRSTVRWSMPP